MNRCLNCNSILNKRTNKYCSNKCQKEYEYKSFIKKMEEWRDKWNARKISDFITY